MRRCEVGIRGNEPVMMPWGVCSACGRRPDPGRPFRRKHTPFEDSRAGPLTSRELPLCDACADALARHHHYRTAGAAVGFLLGLGAYVAYWSVNGMGSVPAALIAVTIDALMAAAAGSIAVVMLGAATRDLWEGSRVARSVKVSFAAPRPGFEAEQYRAYFRFASEEYAREFAAVNAAKLLPGRGRNAIALPASAPAADETPRRR